MRKRKKISFEDSTFSRGGLQLLSPEFGQSLSHCHCKALHFKPIKWKVSVTIKRLLPQVVTLQDNRYNFVACDGTVCCDESGIFVTNSSWVAQCRVKLKKEIKRVSKWNRNFNCCFLMNDRFLWSRQQKVLWSLFSAEATAATTATTTTGTETAAATTSATNMLLRYCTTR